MKKRVVYIDLLRVIAIFAVIMIHVSAENWYVTTVDSKWLMNNFMNSMVGMWAVPLFVTISGSLLLDNEKFNLKNLCIKYLPRIILILFVWHIVYYFYENPYLTISNVIQCFKKLVLGNVYSHLWYLYLVIGLYLLTPILRKLVSTLEKKEYSYMLIIGFIVTSVIPTLDLIFNKGLARISNSYIVLDFNIMLFYYLLGYYLKKWGMKKYQPILICSIFLLLIMSFVQNFISVNKGIPISYSSTNNILAVFIVSSLFCTFKEKFKNKENEKITKLGKLTLGVYLIHFIIEKTLLNIGLNANIMNPVIGNLIITIIIMVLSYVLSYIISKIPIVQKFIS